MAYGEVMKYSTNNFFFFTILLFFNIYLNTINNLFSWKNILRVLIIFIISWSATQLHNKSLDALEANIPIRDIKVLGVVVLDLLMETSESLSKRSFSSVGNTIAFSRLKWYPKKSIFWDGFKTDFA